MAIRPEIRRIYMCGIIGYTGPLQARDVILQGLSQLEYRGYDSAGMALLTDQGMYLRKKVGQVSALEAVCEKDVISHCGIGHTRWATHGGVTDANAHPHAVGKVVLLHNGIIENYHTIILQFGFEGMATSETDTEVAAQLINYYYEQTKNPYEAIRKAIRIIEGSYAFCILFSDIPDQIFSIRNVSPLVAGSTLDQGSFIASDVTALIPYTKSYFAVPEHHILTISRDQILVEDLEGNVVQPQILTVNWDVEAAQKNGYPHFMLKEIHEQPEVFRKTVTPRLQEGLPDFSEEGIPDEIFTSCEQIRVIACGTAMYAGMVGRAIMEMQLRIPVTVSIASEFRYEIPLIDEKTLVIVVSQSGETIDTLAALRLAQECGCKVLSIINVKGSTIARESDYVLYTHAGPEIAVASTKAYMVQLAVLYLITARMMLVRKSAPEAEVRDFIHSLVDSADRIQQMLDQSTDKIRSFADRLAFAGDAFYIGRGLDYAFSLEGALKLKEISYIHAEAYAAGELKHGTIALIEPGIPVVALATQDNIFNKTISNIREVKARDAYVLLITKEGTVLSEDVCNEHLTIPVEDSRFTVFPCAVILQLLAYYTAYKKGFDMDKPRNLAKSVTVE